MVEPADDLRDLTETANAVGLNVMWLKEQARTGRIPATLAGQRWFFNVATVRAVLLERMGYCPRNTSPVELMSLSEFAAKWGTSSLRMRALVDCGLVPAFRSGKRLFVVPTLANGVLDDLTTMDWNRGAGVSKQVADEAAERFRARGIDPGVALSLYKAAGKGVHRG